MAWALFAKNRPVNWAVAHEKNHKHHCSPPFGSCFSGLSFRVIKFWGLWFSGLLSFGVAEFWGRQVLGLSSIGVVKFWGSQVSGSSSFVVVKFWGRPVLGSLSIGVVEFWGCQILRSLRKKLKVLPAPESCWIKDALRGIEPQNENQQFSVLPPTYFSFSKLRCWDKIFS